MVYDSYHFESKRKRRIGIQPIVPWLAIPTFSRSVFWSLLYAISFSVTYKLTSYVSI